MLDKTFDPAKIEDNCRRRLEKDPSALQCDASSTLPPYAIMMPPPNVTGSLHIGHALTYVLQDVLARYQRMVGKDVLFQPGVDHGGIATHMVVERALEAEGLSRSEMGREQFISKVWQWKEQSGGAITAQLCHLGISADWIRERFTLDQGMSCAVRTLFVRLHQDGLIYRDKRLVNWDPVLCTAISDLEVEQRDVEGEMWYLRYPLANGAGHVTIATTRPETMLGDTAVAVHPGDERHAHLIGQTVRLPIVDRLIPIIADDYVDPDKGTGAVKITPAHDFNDFEVGKRAGLEVMNIFDAEANIVSAPVQVLRFDGLYIRPVKDETGSDVLRSLPLSFQRLNRSSARRKVVAAFQELALLDTVKRHAMVVPYGNRSGAVIEPWLTDQWFVDASKMVDKPIEAVRSGRVRFQPKQWEKTFFHWMRTIQPWCVSRQIWWGHQIPAWFGPDGVPFVAMTEEEAHAAAERHYGRPVALVRDPDVLDTWFSSALWPFSTLGWPHNTAELARYYPTDVLVTGFDILFLWVARMMMFGFYAMGETPFKDIYLHALIRDEAGQKMSKSKGNVIDPLSICDKYGADALRFTLAALAAPGRDIRLSENTIVGYRNFATKLWNAARFAQMHQCEMVPRFEPATVRATANRWIVSKTVEASAAVGRNIERRRFDDAAGAAYHFVWDVFCDWHLEFAKPILNGDDSGAGAETRAVTAWVLEQALRLLHPFMPYLTEELWEQLTKHDVALSISAWPSCGMCIDAEAQVEMDWVVNVISKVRSARVAMGASPSVHIPLIVVQVDAETAKRLEKHKILLSTIARLKSIDIVDVDPGTRNAARLMVGEALVLLPLQGVIDVEAAKARLVKDARKHEAAVKSLLGKLNNQAFLTRAPADVVASQKARLTDERAAFAQSVETLSMLEER